MSGKKVGIMGGTFNPVHMGHLVLAEAARCQHCLDEVWFMPSGKPPHKKKQEILPDAQRSDMLRLALEGNGAFSFSDLELKREGIIYTSDTLEILCREHPKDEFYFIIGGDSLMQLESWHEPQEIFRHAVILASRRNGLDGEEFQKKMEELREKYHARIGYVSIPSLEISSAQIRKRICNNESVRYLLPEKVYAYICKNQLYQKKEGRDAANDAVSASAGKKEADVPIQGLGGINGQKRIEDDYGI